MSKNNKQHIEYPNNLQAKVRSSHLKSSCEWECKWSVGIVIVYLLIFNAKPKQSIDKCINYRLKRKLKKISCVAVICKNDRIKQEFKWKNYKIICINNNDWSYYAETVLWFLNLRYKRSAFAPLYRCVDQF